MSLLAGIATAVPIASAAMSDVGNLFYGNRALEQQRELQETTWMREDSAVQRRVADLRAAGLSPTLAAGSPASTSQAMSPIVPRVGNDIASGMAMAMSRIKQKADISKTEVEKQLMELQKNKVIADTMGSLKESAIRDKQLRDMDLNNQILNYDFGLAKKYGVRYDIKGGLQSQVQQGLNAAQSAIDKISSNPGGLGGAALEILDKVTAPRVPNWSLLKGLKLNGESKSYGSTYGSIPKKIVRPPR